MFICSLFIPNPLHSFYACVSTLFCFLFCCCYGRNRQLFSNLFEHADRDRLLLQPSFDTRKSTQVSSLVWFAATTRICFSSQMQSCTLSYDFHFFCPFCESDWMSFTQTIQSIKISKFPPLSNLRVTEKFDKRRTKFTFLNRWLNLMQFMPQIAEKEPFLS